MGNLRRVYTVSKNTTLHCDHDGVKSVSVCVPVGWRLGVVVSVVGRINEVNQHLARLVLGWVTVSGLANQLGV